MIHLHVLGYLVFWVLFAAALGLFAWRLVFLIRLLCLGRAETENRFDKPACRLAEAIFAFVTQKTNLRHLTLSDPAPLGHAFMLWGLGIYLTGYVVFIGFGAGFGLFPVVEGNDFERVFFSVLDVVGLFILAAMIFVVLKRYVLKPQRLQREETTSEKIIQPLLIVTIMLLVVLHYLIEGLGYAAAGLSGEAAGSVSGWPPVGAALAEAFRDSGASSGALEKAGRSLWWFNYVVLLGALVYTPRSKHLHPLFIVPNLAFRHRGRKGALRPVNLQDAQTIRRAEIRDFTWKQLLDSYACTWCGRCHVRCPAQSSGKPLSPRELILGTKEHLLKVGPSLMHGKAAQRAKGAEGAHPLGPPFLGAVIGEEAVWSCTTCLACQEVCPAANEQMRTILDLRRHLQMITTTEVGRETVKNLRTRGHPWRGTMYARTDWAEGLGIKILGEDGPAEVLYWVGCTQALEDRNLKVAQALTQLLKAARVDFGILGEEEMCCGDPARRLGAEHIFQMLAQNNIQLLASYGVQKIVTACPHCYQVLKNEYPELGGKFEVLHHTEFLAELVREGRLVLKQAPTGPGAAEEGVSARLTYHDGCYLGRYNGLYEPPRRLLRAVPGVRLVEIKDNRQNAFCCGGGGGRMWLEEAAGTRINELRLAQALETGASVIATACPYCLQMFEDAIRAKGVEERLQIKDIAEMLVAAVVTKEGESGP